MQHLHQRGGGSRLTLSVQSCRKYDIYRGTLEPLDSSATVSLIRVLSSDEHYVLQAHEFMMVVPYELTLSKCLLSQLTALAVEHGVFCRSRTLSAVRQTLETHICGQGCPPIRWLASYPRPIRRTVPHYRFYDNTGSSGHQFINTVPINVTASVAGVPNTPISRYAFAEPVIAQGAFVPDQPLPSAPIVFPPRPLPLSAKMTIVRNWVMASRSAALMEGPCAVCARNVYLTNRVEVSLDDDCLDLLNIPEAEFCGSDLPTDRVLLPAAVNYSRNVAHICKQCRTSLKKNKRLPRLAMANGLWLGQVPLELADLTFVEKLLVARYRHNVCVVTVNCGARKMHANAVVFSQPVARFSAALPPTKAELGDILAVTFTGPCKPTENDFKRAPFFVRKDVVRRALLWLQQHHRDYADLEISEENLDTYNGSEPPVAWCFQQTDGTVSATSTAVHDNEVEKGVEDGPCTVDVQGICADQVSDLSYDARIALALQHLSSGGRILGYGHASHPESIFHNPRMYPGMFPWLFPYGTGGFENEDIRQPVPLKTHVRHLMNYHDHRFQVDEYFPFMVYNQNQIRASSHGGYVLIEQRNFSDVVDKIMNVDQVVLAELVRRGKKDGFVKPETDAERACFQIMSFIDHVGGHVPGSNTRKKWQRSELRSLIYRYGMPIFFITFSPSSTLR